MLLEQMVLVLGWGFLMEFLVRESREKERERMPEWAGHAGVSQGMKPR